MSWCYGPRPAARRQFRLTPPCSDRRTEGSRESSPRRVIFLNRPGCRPRLSNSRRTTARLIEASADALFAIAPDGSILDVNEEATRLTGYSRKHLVNSKFGPYFTESERAARGVQQTLAERRVIGYELTLITRFGRRITVSFNAGVFTDA